MASQKQQKQGHKRVQRPISSSSSSSSFPLNGTWTLWYDNPRSAPQDTDWKDNVKQVGQFSTLEDFWSMYNQVRPASHLTTHSNYHLFRKGIFPMWEDPANQEGGKFVLTIPKKDSRSGRLDAWWLHTVINVVAETMDESGQDVCGAVVSIRKSQDRISLWLRGNDVKVCLAIGARWKHALEMMETKIKFQLHNDAASSGSSFKNDSKFEI